jgi:glycosyltransferase involved in cell wall biosynthesis
MPNDALRVLQVVGNLELGGGQEVVRTLACHLPAYGCRPVVAAFADGPLRPEIERMGVPVEVLDGRRHDAMALPAAAADLVRIRRALADVIARHRIEVIQTHLLHTLDFVVLTLRGEPGVRSVYWTVHNALLDLRADQLPRHRWLLRPKQELQRLLYRAGGRRIDAFVAVSSDVGAAIRRAYHPRRDRLVVIPNGVDLARFGEPADRVGVRRELELPDDARLLIVVAKFLEQKGHRILLDALPPVLADHPELHVLLAGEGPLRAHLEQQAATGGMASRIHFLGNRRDLPRILAASDLFVLPSLWEGLPMALLEAMASRLPVVATNVSGSREVLADGEAGILAPPGDPRALTAAIAGLLSDPARAAAMGPAGRERVELHYSAAGQAARHAELYRERLGMAPATLGGGA